MEVDGHIQLGSFDIENMYTNIPVSDHKEQRNSHRGVYRNTEFARPNC
jgi:hypothetical protein